MKSNKLFDDFLKMEELCKTLKNKLCYERFEVKISEIESADGRKQKHNPITQKGSILYIAKDINNTVIYVGETSKSIKRRFISDGSGAHKNRTWYSSCKSVIFLKFESNTLSTNERKFLEQALSLILNPKYYGRNT